MMQSWVPNLDTAFQNIRGTVASQILDGVGFNFGGIYADNFPVTGNVTIVDITPNNLIGTQGRPPHTLC